MTNDEIREQRAAALERHWQTIKRGLLAYTQSLAGSDSSDDVLQEACRAFLECSTPLSSDEQVAVVAHFRGIIKHRWIDDFRRNERRPKLDDLDPQELEEIAQIDPLRHEMRVDLDRQIHALPSIDRQILLGRHIEQFDWKELTQQSGLAQRTVIRHHDAAILRLSRRMSAHNPLSSDRDFVTAFLRTSAVVGSRTAIPPTKADCLRALRFAASTSPSNYSASLLFSVALAWLLSRHGGADLPAGDITALLDRFGNVDKAVLGTRIFRVVTISAARLNGLSAEARREALSSFIAFSRTRGRIEDAVRGVRAAIDHDLLPCEIQAQMDLLSFVEEHNLLRTRDSLYFARLMPPEDVHRRRRLAGVRWDESMLEIAEFYELLADQSMARSRPFEAVTLYRKALDFRRYLDGDLWGSLPVRSRQSWW